MDVGEGGRFDGDGLDLVTLGGAFSFFGLFDIGHGDVGIFLCHCHLDPGLSPVRGE